MVLRRKFSAREFWSDVRKHDVTVIQYIGELFRYLVALPPVSGGYSLSEFMTVFPFRLYLWRVSNPKDAK